MLWSPYLSSGKVTPFTILSEIALTNPLLLNICTSSIRVGCANPEYWKNVWNDKARLDIERIIHRMLTTPISGMRYSLYLHLHSIRGQQFSWRGEQFYAMTRKYLLPSEAVVHPSPTTRCTVLDGFPVYHLYQMYQRPRLAHHVTRCGDVPTRGGSCHLKSCHLSKNSFSIIFSQQPTHPPASLSLS